MNSKKAQKTNPFHPTKNDQVPILETKCEKMKKVFLKAEIVARSNASVLITGESGVGKEIIARFIHKKSQRSNDDFVALNCGALPHDLVESELFGHEKGAFTGAVDQKKGCFEQADNGTIFFDEVAEMPLEIQVKLLRAVELGTIRRVGGSKEIQVDVRMISATNKVFPDAIEKGTFREDLYYRLGVIEIDIPPLRDRVDDIPLLTDNFLKYFCNKYNCKGKYITPKAIDHMCRYSWPGNVRELRNILERLTILCPNDKITHDFLPTKICECEPLESSNDRVVIPIGTSIENVERAMIHHTLEKVENNKTKAAKMLGFSRKTLHNKLDKFNLE